MRFGALSICVAVVSASASAAATPDRLDVSSPTGTAGWTFDRAIPNPTGATANPGWTVGGWVSSLTVTLDVFPEKQGSTAQVQLEATWEAPPATLTPGSRFEMPVTVTGRVSGGRDEQFFSGLTATALEDGAWNRDAVGVAVSCVDGPESVVCSEPTTTTGTLSYSIPISGGRFSIGVGALNCGDACDTEWFYVWTEEPATSPPPATDPGDPDTAGPGLITSATADRLDSRAFLELISAEDIEQASVMEGAWVVVADEYLGGRNSVAALVALRDLTDEFYEDKIRHAENNELFEVADLFRQAWARVLTKFDADIEAARERELAEDRTQLGVIHQVLVDGADTVDPVDPPEPSQRVQELVGDLHKADADQTVTDALDSQLLHAVDDAEPGDDPPPTTAPTTEPPTPSTTTAAPTTTTPNNPSTDPPTADHGLDRKPLRFSNSGFVSVGVRAATYDPAPGLESVAMSRASTIVFPGTNPSSYLSLPQGTYTFCYDWDLGTDDDGDGVFDEVHALTRTITLGRDTPDDPLRAPVMTLNPDAGGTPGSCAGDDPPSAGQLTLRELAARDAATYQMACTFADGTSTNRHTTYWFEFIGDGADWWEVGADAAVALTRIDPNIYVADPDADQSVWIEFTEDGFDVWGDGVGNLQNCFAARET